MDLLKTLLSDSSSEAIGALNRVGFDQDLAERFLPEAGKQLANASTQADGLDSGNLFTAVDVAALSNATNVPVELVEKGLHVLLPMIMGRLNAGFASGLLSTARTLF